MEILVPALILLILFNLEDALQFLVFICFSVFFCGIIYYTFLTLHILQEIM